MTKIGHAFSSLKVEQSNSESFGTKEISDSRYLSRHQTDARVSVQRAASQLIEIKSSESQDENLD